jgi:hypothetical protein
MMSFRWSVMLTMDDPPENSGPLSGRTYLSGTGNSSQESRFSRFHCDIPNSAQTWQRIRGILAFDASPFNPPSPQQRRYNRAIEG